MEPEQKSNGAFVGIVIIVIILLLGGIYMWQQSKNTTDKNIQPSGVQSETITDQDSATLNALEADIQTTDTSTGVDVNAVY